MYVTLDDLRRNKFLTVLSIPIIVRLPMFWTTSMRFHSERPMKGAQQQPACVSMGEMLSLRSRVPSKGDHHILPVRSEVMVFAVQQQKVIV